MTEDEIERLTVLLHDGYPCGQIGCGQTGETFAALVAEVRRLRGLVEAAYHEALSYAGEGWCTDDTKNAWAHADARKALEAA